MKKSEFIISYANDRRCREAYAEAPTGLYEYLAAYPSKFIPYVDFALNGLKMLKREINHKTLDRQFDYVVHEWLNGNYMCNENGKIQRNKNEEDAKILCRENYAMLREHLDKDKSPVEKDEPFCPYPGGGYCDRLICDGSCCIFHPDYKGELPEQMKRKAGPTAVHDF